MAVIIGSARVDERGKYSGGSATNNIPKEISTQEWYLHSKGWFVIRPKDPVVAEKIAQNMEAACESKYIGYDQSENTDLYYAVKPLAYEIAKLKTYCETDCARLVRVCILYAGIYVPDFYTGNMFSVLDTMDEFETFKTSDYCNSSKKLRRGDILVTRTKGHTVVVLSNGSEATSDSTSSVIKLGSKGFPVKEIQQDLITLGYSCGDYGADGDFGNSTLAAVKKFQKDHNLTDNGIVDEKVKNLIKDLVAIKNKCGLFLDVNKSDSCFEAVKWAISKNITSGKTATMFMPKDKCTRAEAITFLWRFAGMPKLLKKTNPFVDVKPSNYYYDAVLWAVENDITKGIAKDKFMPDELVTRSQFVTFLYRYNKQPLNKTSAKNPFVDVAQTDYFYNAVLWAADNKITSGTSATKFSPDDACTREQAITFLWRAK